MNADSVKAIVDQYARHDWCVRRFLLTNESRNLLAKYLKEDFPEIRIETAAKDAIWFSRRSLPDREAWELRRMSDTPFALVTVLLDSSDEDEKQSLLADTQTRMFDDSRAEPTSH